jgi:long-chain fatty acid transport protein
VLDSKAGGLQNESQYFVGNRKRWRFALAAWLVVMSPLPAQAGNGINLIGFGIESNLMAGADVALARDTGAVSTNPAGLSQTSGKALDNHGAVAFGGGVGHRDQFDNDVRVDNDIIATGDFGFAMSAPESRFAWGIGLFGQGGAGYVYKNLNTAFGMRDDLSALLRIAKLNPGFAYKATDKLSLGLSIPIVYADLKQNIFSETSQFNASAPALSFFGNELKDAHATNAGIKLGMQYRATESLTLGMTYANQIGLKLRDGKLKVNYDSVGLGRVTYGDAQVEGLHLPQEVALGAAQRIGERWLLSVKLSWLDWSRAFRSSTLTASSPDNSLAPASVSNSADLNWRDQYVVALGVTFEATPATTFMAGLNYGRNPIPAETTSPLLAAFTELHATLGFIHKINSNWHASAGIEYDFAKTVTYTNPQLPFGANTQERNEVFAIHLGISRRW